VTHDGTLAGAGTTASPLSVADDGIASGKVLKSTGLAVEWGTNPEFTQQRKQEREQTAQQPE
jgi:hypothetical protein